MGVLSAFCIAVVAFALDKILGAKSSEDSALTEIWRLRQWYVLAASGLMFVAAYCFYRQRARLAWHYGQICLCLSGVLKEEYEKDVKNWLKRADSWQTWRFYYTAFSFVLFAFIYYGIAIVFPTSNWITDYCSVIIWIPIVGLFLFDRFRYIVFKLYKFKCHPYKEFFANGCPLKKFICRSVKKLQIFVRDFFPCFKS